MIDDKLSELVLWRQVDNLDKSIEIALKKKANSVTQPFSNEAVIA